MNNEMGMSRNRLCVFFCVWFVDSFFGNVHIRFLPIVHLFSFDWMDGKVKGWGGKGYLASFSIYLFSRLLAFRFGHTGFYIYNNTYLYIYL